MTKTESIVIVYHCGRNVTWHCGRNDT